MPFKLGIANVIPREYSLKDGMGPGGVTAITIEVGEQKSAYVIFDGNNLISGLREKLLYSLRSMGISVGEILTTDTHSVNGVTLAPRGYHPIGEVMDHSLVIKYVREVVSKAIGNIINMSDCANNPYLD